MIFIQVEALITSHSANSGPLFPNHIYKFGLGNDIWLHRISNLRPLFESISHTDKLLLCEFSTKEAYPEAGRG